MSACRTGACHLPLQPEKWRARPWHDGRLTHKLGASCRFVGQKVCLSIGLRWKSGKIRGWVHTRVGLVSAKAPEHQGTHTPATTHILHLPARNKWRTQVASFSLPVTVKSGAAKELSPLPSKGHP